MRSFYSIATRLRRNTNRAFHLDEDITPTDTGLGYSLGSYFLTDEESAEWVLFERGVWDLQRDRIGHFANVAQVLPVRLMPEHKLLHFSPTLVFADHPPLHLRCKGRDCGALNHGWAIRDALNDIFSALDLNLPVEQLYDDHMRPFDHPRSE